MITCPHCGRQVLDNSRFCDGCGMALAQVAGSPSQSSAALCPRCGQPSSGDAYCENCGAVLAPAPTNVQPMPSPRQLVVQTPIQPLMQPARQTPAPAATRFMLQPANIIFPFPAGKQMVLIGREDPERNLVPEINLEAYGGAEAGVSRQHACVRLDGAQWLLEHLSQTNKTVVNDSSLAQGQAYPLKDGDVVGLGRLTLIFRT